MKNGFKKVLLKNVDDPKSHTLKAYLKNGGYEALKKVLSKMEPAAVIEEVKEAGLRGRGGAGFPAGLKWMFASKDPKDPKFIFCNADEGEPGTFKDRQIIMGDPHMLIEGMIIAGFAVGATNGLIYIRGEYPFGFDRLMEVVDEARKAGYLAENIQDSGFGFDITVHMGAGAYVCGEETALIDSVEGKRGQPRIRPPFPVSEGYLRLPTVVNNVETLSNVPHIINHGAKWYKAIGPENCPGPKIFGISGHVKNPGIFELPMGTSLKEIIYEHAGGIRDGHELKAVIPGGISTPVLLPEKIDVPMDFDSLPKVDSMLGSGAIIGLAVAEVLRPRVVRQVHPLPRRRSRDARHGRADPQGRRRHDAGPRVPRADLRGDPGHDLLPPRRRGRLQPPLDPHPVPLRVRSAHRKGEVRRRLGIRTVGAVPRRRLLTGNASRKW
jgi:NADH-quinone oxidoreductase subunit F